MKIFARIVLFSSAAALMLFGFHVQNFVHLGTDAAVAAQANPATYRCLNDEVYAGRTDGWCVDASYNLYYMVNGSSVVTISSAGAFDFTGSGITLQNDETIANSADDGEICFGGGGATNNENWCMEFENTANTINFSSDTGVDELEWTINSESLILTATSNLLTFSSDTSATIAFTPATTITGDLTLGGGAGALTTTGAASSLLAKDATADAWCMGAAGALDLLCIDTADATAQVDVTGVSGQVGLHVDAGDTQLDEDLTIGAGAAGVDYTLTFNGETNDGIATYDEDNDILAWDGGMTVGTTFQVLNGGVTMGWTAAAAANTACATTCAGTGACVFGYDADGTAVVACDSAAADSCICAGPAS